ncbi:MULTISPECIES: hypothetical protein [Bacillaceae]|uniref:hypothetical protein n=1 Tax=Bacillaceae TaxID=186817 RepID=UPI001BDE4D72|nr:MULTISPECIES: hypothetical protein [Bacillaceae]MDX8360688.1 hypothetical protein [Cytobacillus sp. IB215316]
MSDALQVYTFGKDNKGNLMPLQGVQVVTTTDNPSVSINSLTTDSNGFGRATANGLGQSVNTVTTFPTFHPPSGTSFATNDMEGVTVTLNFTTPIISVPPNLDLILNQTNTTKITVYSLSAPNRIKTVDDLLAQRKPLEGADVRLVRNQVQKDQQFSNSDGVAQLDMQSSTTMVGFNIEIGASGYFKINLTPFTVGENLGVTFDAYLTKDIVPQP